MIYDGIVWFELRGDRGEPGEAPTHDATLAPVERDADVRCRACDHVVFVDVPESERLQRVRFQRGWDSLELHRREILQMPLDKKKEMSDHVLVNTAPAAISEPAEADDIRNQVRKILSRIVAGLPIGPDVA